MKAVVVIPARLHSTRLPGKLLVDLCGKPLISHVYERASQASRIDRVLVATDSEEIYRVIQKQGGEVYMTSPRHPSGTDRIAELVEKGVGADLIVNVQGDLPLLNPKMIDQALGPFSLRQDAVMSTLKRAIQSREELNSPHVVKVVTDSEGRALYFSRSPIPFVRDQQTGGGIPNACYFKHYGLYVYRREFLLTFTKLPMGRLEALEKLEQLRALEHGYPIDVIETEYDSWEVDTAEDLERVRQLLSNEGL
jgi:3-deoxy-manno-octulosonate cytidylyltransferase (CMP-KDO synthetase)